MTKQNTTLEFTIQQDRNVNSSNYGKYIAVLQIQTSNGFTSIALSDYMSIEEAIREKLRLSNCSNALKLENGFGFAEYWNGVTQYEVA